MNICYNDNSTTERDDSMKIAIKNGAFLRLSETAAAKADIWFIHGFGASGDAFREALASPLAAQYNLYIPDLPGCGASPPAAEPLSMRETADLIAGLIGTISAGRPLAIVAHSLGGILGTWLCQTLGKRIKTYINVEGNLTEADAYFTGLAGEYDSAAGFYAAYKSKVFALLAAGGDALHRYYASVLLADPEALWVLGKSCVQATGEKKSGAEFVRLDCPKRYYWGDVSTPPQNREFIARMNLPYKLFPGCGHSPMIDNPGDFYRAVLHDLQAAQ